MTTGDIVTLADAKTWLNISSSANDTLLGDFISAASTMWTRRVGPVSGSPSYDEWYDGGTSQIVLRHTPVQSVTSVLEAYSSSFTRTLTQHAPDSGSGSAFDYSLDDTVTGTLTRRANGVAIPFAFGERNIHIVYVAGYATVPADIKQAVMLLIGHMWETQRGRMVLPGQPTSDTWNPATSFTWPRRVQEIADTYMIPGIG